MLPSYISEISLEELKERRDKLYEFLEACKLCPNECGIDRRISNNGNCRSGYLPMVSSYAPHFGEEPPLVGRFGSGTIFFTNCNLDCKFCQNYDISHYGIGREVSINDLADMMIYLQNRGCHNINFVTPTHFTPQIVDALIIARERGLEIPLVYNCGGYESVETLKLLDKIIDIYMPDIKYSSNENGLKYSGISNYWDIVRPAVKEMHRQVGDLKISTSGIAKRGLLIRHLVLPNDVSGSRKVLDFIAKEISIDSYVNIMDQYRPVYLASKFPEIDRTITSKEYFEVVNYAKEIGLHRGFEIIF
ncbi:MAG: radical SAM protein [Ignavibacteria bacterium]|jgi:putative pyruvate formate lyase activating enzyme|nr:radical SAM protein [Ignavibacteria bacterium]MDH7527411.1 radical SAM protein [Ignavibacteria bacterium]